MSVCVQCLGLGSEDEFSRNNESDFFVKGNHENTTKRQQSEPAVQVCVVVLVVLVCALLAVVGKAGCSCMYVCMYVIAAGR